MPSNKVNGSKVECELLRFLTESERGWRAVRFAGSGVNDDSPCELLAAKIGRRVKEVYL